MPQRDASVPPFLRAVVERLLGTEMVRFGLVSVAALVVDVSVLVALREGAGLPPLAAAAVGFLTGALFHYALSVRFVFRYRRLSSRAAELGTFAALSAVGLALVELVMWLATSVYPGHYLVAKGVATVVVFFFNFFAKKLVLFTPFSPAQAPGGTSGETQ